MSSKRFKGKMLYKMKKGTLLDFVYQKCIKTKIKTVVLTSFRKDDQKIIQHCKKNKYPYLQGPLNDVYKRYCNAIKKYNLDFFIRITGDSPKINYFLLKKMVKIFLKEKKIDILTNCFPRSYPIGQTIEVINAKKFLKNYSLVRKNSIFKEHITSFFYKNSNRFNIINLKNKKDQSNLNMAIDTRKDLKKLIK